VVTLDSYTVELLRACRATSEEQCGSLGIEMAISAFVFSLAPDFSTAIRSDTMTQRYRRIAKRNHLRSTRIHALRHYSATELLSAGIDLRTVAGRLGQGSGGATTLRYYAAWVEEADNRAADAIAGVIPRPDPLRRAPRYPYELLAADLRKAIENGTYASGSPLPTSVELAAAHDVSVGTVSRAVSLLKSAGLITARRGQRAIVR
jgi:integrase